MTFVEADGRAADVLRRNAGQLGLPGARVVRGDVLSVLSGPADRRYDVVLADPPYALEAHRLDLMLDTLVAGSWLTERGVIVVERSVRDPGPAWPPPIAPIRRRRYGDTVLHWASWSDDEPPSGRDAPDGG